MARAGTSATEGGRSRADTSYQSANVARSIWYQSVDRGDGRPASTLRVGSDFKCRQRRADASGRSGRAVQARMEEPGRGCSRREHETREHRAAEFLYDGCGWFHGQGRRDGADDCRGRMQAGKHAARRHAAVPAEHHDRDRGYGGGLKLRYADSPQRPRTTAADLRWGLWVLQILGALLAGTHRP